MTTKSVHLSLASTNKTSQSQIPAQVEYKSQW